MISYIVGGSTLQTTIDIMSAVGRWTNNQFLLRSSFYTGRGVNTGDLNSRLLERIYQGIKAEVGQAEATNFAKFVAGLKDLSASAFIQAFEQFWHGGCKDKDLQQTEGTGNQISGQGEERYVEAFVLIANAFGGGRNSSPQETESQSRSLKREFIHNHREEIGGAFDFEDQYRRKTKMGR